VIALTSSIAAALSVIRVGFERWEAARELADDADEAAVFEAYGADIERLVRAGGYQSKDIVRLNPAHPGREALRAKFLKEHTHSDDEVRIFVEGGATFFLHAGGKVFELYAERGDLIRVPAGAKHWFDTGEEPHFTAIRLFTSPAGWEANYTGDPISERFAGSAAA
jgi:1,2-dihydroxy-3-keto-5-methylthiopentene dioxygenase